MLPAFVKKYDFRGIYGRDITDKDAYYLGLALAKTIPLKKVLVGWDTRDSSRNLALQFITALKKGGTSISFMEKCPIEYVAAAANASDQPNSKASFDLSVMFTGSHNLWTWTGLLMHIKGGDSVQDELVTKIVENYYESTKEPYETADINLSELENYIEEFERIYIQRLTSLLPVKDISSFQVLVDVGDGSGSRPLFLLEKLLPQIKFSRLHDRNIYNGSSGHTADPSQIENMKDIINKVKHGEYDCGFAFDSDADRVLAVDESGNYLNGSLLGSAMAESFIRLGLSDAAFGYSVDCGPSMYNAVIKMSKTSKQLSIKPLPVGRSILRKMLRAREIDFGIENVGHFYSKDFFMTDSGIFSLVIILYWMSVNAPLSTLKEKYPDGMRGQIFMPIESGEEPSTNYLYSKINKRYEGKLSAKKIEVDGLRYEFFEGEIMTTWYSVRKSGYEQVEKYYFGSLHEEEFKFLNQTFEELFEEKRRKYKIK